MSVYSCTLTNLSYFPNVSEKLDSNQRPQGYPEVTHIYDTFLYL